VHVRHIDSILLGLRDDREKFPRISSILARDSLQPPVRLRVGLSRPVRLIVFFTATRCIQDVQIVRILSLRRIVGLCYDFHLFMVRQNTWCCLCLVLILDAASAGFFELCSFGRIF
jgi:hypothetical protein